MLRRRSLQKMSTPSESTPKGNVNRKLQQNTLFFLYKARDTKNSRFLQTSCYVLGIVLCQFRVDNDVLRTHARTLPDLNFVEPKKPHKYKAGSSGVWLRFFGKLLLRFFCNLFSLPFFGSVFFSAKATTVSVASLTSFAAN